MASPANEPGQKRLEGEPSARNVLEVLDLPRMERRTPQVLFSGWRRRECRASNPPRGDP